MHFQSETRPKPPPPRTERQSARSRFSRAGARRGQRERQSQRVRDVCAHRATWACVCVLGAHMSVTRVSHRNTGALAVSNQTRNSPHNHSRGRREINGKQSLNFSPIRRNCGTNRVRAERCAPNSDQILSRAGTRHPCCLAGARPPRSSRSLQGTSLEPLEIIRRQVCLGVRAQVVSSVSGYLEAASSHLELPGYLERPQDISRVLQVISSRSR